MKKWQVEIFIIKKLNKLKKTYGNQMQNVKMNIIWKLKLKRQLEIKKNYKVKPKTKTTKIQKTSTGTVNEGDIVSTTGGNITTGNKDN